MLLTSFNVLCFNNNVYYIYAVQWVLLCNANSTTIYFFSTLMLVNNTGYCLPWYLISAFGWYGSSRLVEQPVVPTTYGARGSPADDLTCGTVYTAAWSGPTPTGRPALPRPRKRTCIFVMYKKRLQKFDAVCVERKRAAQNADVRSDSEALISDNGNGFKLRHTHTHTERERERERDGGVLVNDEELRFVSFSSKWRRQRRKLDTHHAWRFDIPKTTEATNWWYFVFHYSRRQSVLKSWHNAHAL